MPDAVGATEDEIADVEERLGMSIPEELKAILRVTRARYGDYVRYGEDERYDRDIKALGGIELFGLDGIERASEADVRTEPSHPWLADTAVVTRSDSAVQGLVASPGWIVIGDHGGGTGDWTAIDVLPGPSGHVGQVVVLDHESKIGARLLAESLPDLVINGATKPSWPSRPGEEPPEVVRVNSSNGHSVEAAATEQLEVLKTAGREPSDLTPLVGLPRLRTLIAQPGAIADPVVSGDLTGLEYLQIGLTEWRALLDADAVPRSPLAAGVSGHRLSRVQVDLVYEALIRLWSGERQRTSIRHRLIRRVKGRYQMDS
ncbi:hypothetical protein GCM10027447_03980 [Glycomyces halotolerans]